MLDEHTMLYAFGRWVDESYDDEFGIAKHMAFQVDKLSVVVWICGIDYDVTDSIPRETLLRWQEVLLDAHALEPPHTF